MVFLFLIFVVFIGVVFSRISVLFAFFKYGYFIYVDSYGDEGFVDIRRVVVRNF